jgi:hypothetical protein
MQLLLFIVGVILGQVSVRLFPSGKVAFLLSTLPATGLALAQLFC